MPDPYDSQRGQIIGEYRLVQKLGGGGFGSVYLAEHIHKHSQVAIKILQVPLTKGDDFRDFINETRTMIRLRHPHIIPLLDVGLSREDFPFFVMEYASGGTVRDRHPKGSQVPLTTIVDYVDQITSALQYAHDCRIIHRDVKPENLLLRSDGALLLTDFGIAKIMEQNTLMSVQKLIGTPLYMAPEQHKGYPCFASDQYALAVVVYEWISGTRPFHGSREWLAIQHVTAPPPSLLNLLPTLPPTIEQVISKALSKTPEQRFLTIQDFATAFRAAVQQPPVSQVDTTQLTLDKPPSEETFIQQPMVPPPSIYAKPPTNTPLTPQPPFASHSAETEAAPIGQVPSHPPPSFNQPYTPYPTTHTPLPITVARRPSKAEKAPRRLSPSKRNLLLLSVVLSVALSLVLLVGSLIVAIIRNTPSANPPTSSNIVTKWTFPTGDQVTSLPAVAGGVVYVGSVDKNVYAIDAQSGQKKWAFRTGSAVYSSPAVVGDTVYVGSGDGNVYAIDIQLGQKKWAFRTGNFVDSSPAVVDNVVYVGSDDKNVYAIDAQSGKQKWAFPTGNWVTSSPAVVDNVVYVGSDDKNVYAIDAQSGKQKWAFPTGNWVTSLPAVVGGVVYVGSQDNNVYAIDAQSGQKKWAFPTGNNVHSSPAVVDNVVYIGSDDKNVYAVDAQSGQKKWAFPTGNWVTSSPAVINNVVYVGSQDKNVYAIDAQSGKQKWAFPTRGPIGSSPALGDGGIYVGSNDSNVYAFDLPTTTS